MMIYAQRYSELWFNFPYPGQCPLTLGIWTVMRARIFMLMRELELRLL